MRDYAQVRGAGKIDEPTAQAALEMLEVDKHGFDEIDRKLLLTIIEKYQGGPVGLNTLAAALAEEPDAIEDIYEPFLIQIGFLDRTPRGRQATRLAYEHFGSPCIASKIPSSDFAFTYRSEAREPTILQATNQNHVVLLSIFLTPGSDEQKAIAQQFR